MTISCYLPTANCIISSIDCSHNSGIDSTLGNTIKRTSKCTIFFRSARTNAMQACSVAVQTRKKHPQGFCMHSYMFFGANEQELQNHLSYSVIFFGPQKTGVKVKVKVGRVGLALRCGSHVNMYRWKAMQGITW